MTQKLNSFTPSDREISALLRRMADMSTKTFEANVDGLLRVRVDGAMRVLDIEVLDSRADPHAKAVLETAAAAAINLALQKAALAAGEMAAPLHEAPGTVSES